MIQLLSDKRVSILIVIIAILARAIQLLFYLDSFFDTTFQVIATHNLVTGHGITTSIVNAQDLSQVIYEPLINWPPGYSLLLAPFYLLCGGDYLVACYIVDLLAATAIILLCRKILSLLDMDTWVINLFTILTAFFIYYFFYTGSTDSISIAFFLGAICSTLAALKTNRHWTRTAVISAICLLLSASLKYLFFPVVFTLPVFLFIYGYQNKSTVIRKASLLSFGILLGGIGGLYLYQQSISGTGAHISSPGRGFFPEHLLRAHPFLPASFATPNTIRKLPGNAAEMAMNFFRIIHVVGLLLILFIAIRSFLKKGLKQASIHRTFLFLALAISLAITVVLAGLSLVVDKELMPPDRWWTYVEDARYYGLAEILVHIAVFYLFSLAVRERPKTAGILLLSLPLLLLPEIARGVTFTMKRVIRYGNENYYWQQEKEFYDQVASSIKKKQDSLQVTRTVVTGSLYYGNHRSSLIQQIPVLDEVTSLNMPGSLQTTQPVLLLAIIRHDSREGFSQFINYPGTELAGQFNGFYFYTLYVTPR